MVAADIARQIAGGSSNVCGLMLESHLVEGRQDDVNGRQGLVYGQSVTDARIGWDTTVAVLAQLADAVRQRRAGNRSRWPVHPLWSMLAEHIDTLPAQGVYREVDPRVMLDETLIRMAISMPGYLKKIAAIECLKEGRPMLSQGQTIDRLIPLLEKVHNGLTWRGDVQRRVDQLRIAVHHGHPDLFHFF